VPSNRAAWHTARMLEAPTPHARLLRGVTNAAVATAVLLALAKLFGWWRSGSIALLASMVDSTMDIAASLLNALAVRYAQKPADDEHRFGHGKSEALAGLAQAVLIGASAFYLLGHAIARLLHPQALVAISAAIVVMGLSIVMTLALVLYQRHAVRVTASQAVKADALHFVGDLGANLGTILALALAPFGWSRLDPIVGILIASGTAYGALHIGWETFQTLMDRELPPEIRQRIRDIASQHPDIHGLHNLRTRRAGPTTLIQFHLEMDGNLSLHEANRIAHEVGTSIRAEIPGADVIIHQDPARETLAS
jgi:ferrous-iron efflux pump FieF